jgi:hypothetical protein
LTGKLSDVAGLIVAPVLLCVLVGARRPVSRLICFFAVASVFAGQNLSEQVATVLVDVVSVFGIRWTIVTEPSDLLALVSQPLAWWLVNEGGVRLGPGRPMVARALLFVGVWACVATSEDGGDQGQSTSTSGGAGGSTTASTASGMGGAGGGAGGAGGAGYGGSGGAGGAGYSGAGGAGGS